MHTVVVRRELAAEHPELLRAVYDGFCNSRDAAIDQYRHGRIFNNMDHCMVPWLPRLLDENRRLFSDGWFPYGVDANRTMVDTLLRYHHEQGCGGGYTVIATSCWTTRT